MKSFPKPTPRWPRRTPPSAFTLIEIMVVIGVLGIVLTMSIPSIYQLTRKEGMRKTVAEVLEVCANARRAAIMGGRPAALHIRPLEGRFDVESSVARPAPSEGGDSETQPEPAEPRSNSGLSAQISEGLAFEMVDVARTEYKDMEEVLVWFYADGTSDELTLVLRSDKNEFRKIALEPTTGLATAEIIGSK